MNPLIYKIVHIFGLLMVFAGVGGMTLEVASGGDGSRGRRLAGIAQGIGLVLMLVSGFGMLAKLDLHVQPMGWVVAKVGIWLLLAAFPVLVRRLSGLAGLLWWILPLIGALAASLAIFKPF